MKLKYLLVVTCLFPMTVWGASRGDARVGMSRAPASRAPTVSTNLGTGTGNSTTTGAASGVITTSTGLTLTPNSGAVTTTAAAADGESGTGATATNAVPMMGGCRDAYRQCMDEFCLLDESEGYRCACSDNINKSKELIKEIQDIQEKADVLFLEGVEKEKLGTRERRLVFGESEAAKKSSRMSNIDFNAWLNVSSGTELDQDDDLGDNLYAMASEYCANRLAACGDDADMEEMLYARQIVADCKTFSAYLTDEKYNVNQNLRTAEAAVRAARLEMLDSTNKYNSGECLLAYRACIADKGGCGANFENCLDAKLLARRADACEQILDQCTATRDYVLQNWAEESKMILADAAKYADRNQRATCLARIQDCLEVSCSTSTDSACLTDVNVAAGVCPVIGECDQLIPGIKDVIGDKLGFLRLKFCENDVDKCLQDKCGVNYDAPECMGKKTADIVAMCPQSMFPSCKGETQYDVIVSAALLQMDYQMLQGCLNYFSEQLGRACGTDMSCLPSDDTVMALSEMPKDEEDIAALRVKVRENSKKAVDEFFEQFQSDKTVAACSDSTSGDKRGRKNKNSLGDNVFNTAKFIAEINAENRAMRELETKMAELSRKQDLAAAEQNCKNAYKPEDPKQFEKMGKKNYSYIRSVHFEPALRNCHVCRMQQVCETGGISKGAGGLRGLAGGLAAGASMGTTVSPGWGTAIGGVVGAVGGLFAGRSASGTEEYCQEIESCEDINM